jgi:hypothetical protein
MTEWVKVEVNEDSNFVVIPGGMTKFSNLWMSSVLCLLSLEVVVHHTEETKTYSFNVRHHTRCDKFI